MQENSISESAWFQQVSTLDADSMNTQGNMAKVVISKTLGEVFKDSMSSNVSQDAISHGLKIP